MKKKEKRERGRKQNRKRTININCIEYVKYRFLVFIKVKFIAPLVVYLVPKFPRTPRTILSRPSFLPPPPPYFSFSSFRLVKS